ncbi:PREDICTED: uncharacterized protein LOC108569183 [Nicrophorus vespilloides]|uniref:Uncharacterized protein LOC108569183 n=1 Tax=Nicrophorus vespilloides TaxID=110193 RepID=A0ABM1NH36_NICVS|nr:PREDICTED: uncharacterized protein LOC108569183 [Nicrophorus vespilloides]
MNNQFLKKNQGDRSPNRMSKFVNHIIRQYRMRFEQRPEYFKYTGTEVEMESVAESIVRGVTNRVRQYRTVTMNLGELIRLKMPQLVSNPDTSATDQDISTGLFSPIVPHALHSEERNSYPIVEDFPIEGAAQPHFPQARPVRLPRGQNVDPPPIGGVIAVQYYVPVPPRLLPARIPNPALPRVRHLPVPPRAVPPVLPHPPRVQPPIAARVPPPQDREFGPPPLQHDMIRDFGALNPLGYLSPLTFFNNAVSHMYVTMWISKRLLDGNAINNSAHFLRIRANSRWGLTSQHSNSNKMLRRRRGSDSRVFNCYRPEPGSDRSYRIPTKHVNAERSAFVNPRYVANAASTNNSDNKSNLENSRNAANTKLCT